MRRGAKLGVEVVHALVWLPYLAPRNWWMRRKVGDALTDQLVVVPTLGGGPGYVIGTYAPPMWRRKDRGQVQHDACTYLDREGSFLKVTGYGTVGRYGDADEVMGKVIEEFREYDRWSYQPIARERIAGEDARRARFDAGALRVTEWRFDHQGYAFAAGAAVRRTVDEDEVLERARRSLASWQWTEPDPG